MIMRNCELCKGEAAVYCSADEAFLCWSCDSEVHEDNFLAARHNRQCVCFNCRNLTGDQISGVDFVPFPAICSLCAPVSVDVDDDDEEDDDSISSSSSVCISSTTSFSSVTSGKRRREAAKSPAETSKSEGIFVNWCGKLGLRVGSDVAVRTACGALKICLDRWTTALPFRVCLAASMWHGLRLSGEKPLVNSPALKRLEEISGVPAKIILAAQSKLERALRRRRVQPRRLELEEGWAESS